jgi:hypothetical protein
MLVNLLSIKLIEIAILFYPNVSIIYYVLIVNLLMVILLKYFGYSTHWFSMVDQNIYKIFTKSSRRIVSLASYLYIYLFQTGNKSHLTNSVISIALGLMFYIYVFIDLLHIGRLCSFYGNLHNVESSLLLWLGWYTAFIVLFILKIIAIVLTFLAMLVFILKINQNNNWLSTSKEILEKYLFKK